MCVRTGTETQAKFTSVELLREYISVRNQCVQQQGLLAPAEPMQTFDLFTFDLFSFKKKGIFLKTEIRPKSFFLKPIFIIQSKALELRERFFLKKFPQGQFPYTEKRIQWLALVSKN